MLSSSGSVPDLPALLLPLQLQAMFGCHRLGVGGHLRQIEARHLRVGPGEFPLTFFVFQRQTKSLETRSFPMARPNCILPYTISAWA